MRWCLYTFQCGKYFLTIEHELNVAKKKTGKNRQPGDFTATQKNLFFQFR